MVFNKKAISPVVATALLLVVAVVAVVGFQTWFNTYQSGINTKVEQEGKAGSAITVERLEKSGTDAIIYIKNAATENVTINGIKINLASDSSPVCSNTSLNSDAAKSAVTQFNVSGCSLSTGTSYGVTVVTATGVFSETEIAR